MVYNNSIGVDKITDELKIKTKQGYMVFLSSPLALPTNKTNTKPQDSYLNIQSSTSNNSSILQLQTPNNTLPLQPLQSQTSNKIPLVPPPPHTSIQNPKPPLTKNPFPVEINPPQTPNISTQDIKILYEFSKAGYPRTATAFTSYFRSRYQKLSVIIKRNCFFDKPVFSIHSLVQNQPATIIGIIYDIKKLPNSYRITVEDLTGMLTVIVPANNVDAFEKTKNIFTDMVLAFTGVLGGKNAFFCNNIILPDIPLQNKHKQNDALQNKQQKTEKPDVSFVFISDLHIGSKNFLKKTFQHFVDWVCGHYDGTLGVESSKIAVIFVTGDLVAGINIYKDQQNDLLFQDLKKQYDEVARYFSKIPNTIKIVVIPGNHDAQRLPTPQPPIMKKYAQALYDLPNVIMTSSPSMISAYGTNVLLDHGTSVFVLADMNADFKAKLISEPQKIGKFLLQARHLYPVYGAARGVLSPELEDDLVIDKIPDIFAFGHVHSCGYMNYRGVHIINPGCFEGMTDYEEKSGMVPNPGWAYVYNLATDSVRALCFLDDEEKKLVDACGDKACILSKDEKTLANSEKDANVSKDEKTLANSEKNTNVSKDEKTLANSEKNTNVSKDEKTLANSEKDAGGGTHNGE